jgi:hypothetical protein
VAAGVSQADVLRWAAVLLIVVKDAKAAGGTSTLIGGNGNVIAPGASA